MASRFYPSAKAAPYTPATVRGAWDDTASHVVTELARPKPTPVESPGDPTSITLGETTTTGDWDRLLVRCVSRPLKSKTLSGSGTIQVNMGVDVNSASMNAHWHVHVYVTQGDSDTIRATLLTDYTEALGVNEWPATDQGWDLNAAQVVSGSWNDGDRLVIELGYVARNTDSTSYLGELWYGGNTLHADMAAGSGDETSQCGWIEFSEDGIEELDNSDARLTQIPVEVLLGALVDARISHLPVEVLVRSESIPDPGEPPPDGENLCGASGVHLFAIWKPDGSTSYGYSTIDLNDPASYYGGYKAPHLLDVSDVARQLSTRTGDYQGAVFAVRLSDADRSKRALLSSGATQFFMARPLEVYLISDAGRRIQAAPLLVAGGEVSDAPSYSGSEELDVTLTARDYVTAAQLFSPRGSEKVYPVNTITRTHWPTAPSDAIGRVIPRYYGTWSDAPPADVSPPVWNPSATYGGNDSGTGYTLEHGEIPEPPVPPTNVLLTEAAGGEMAAADYTGGKCLAVVTAIKDGVESDPSPFLAVDSSITITGTGKKVTVSWTASVTSGVVYRVYFGHDYFGYYCVQWIETAGTSIEVTRSTPFSSPPNAGNVTPGWTPDAAFNRYFYYGLTAFNAAGEETDVDAARGSSAVAFGRSAPFRFRPIRGRWNAATNAVRYRVYRKALPAGWPWTQYWDVGNVTTFQDDGDDAGAVFIEGVTSAEGVIPTVYVGDVALSDEGAETFRELLVHEGAGTAIDHWYYNDGTNPIEVDQGEGTDFLIPRRAGWNARFGAPYRDIVGSDGTTIRCTVLYARGTKGDAIAAGTATLRVNLRGVEDTGVGAGELITDLHDQMVHALDNLDQADGTWVATPPTLPTGVNIVERDSFTALKTMRAGQVSGGYVGHLVLGANGQVTLPDLLAQFMRSAACRIGVNRWWQIAAWAIDEGQSRAAVANEITDLIDVQRNTVTLSQTLDTVHNVFPYRFGEPVDSSGAWAGEGEHNDDTAIANFRQRRRSEDLELPWVRSAAVATHVIGQHARERVTVPTVIEIESNVADLCWTGPAWDLGAYVTLTHYRGLGSSGYAARVFWIVGHTVAPMRRSVRLALLDVHDQLSA